MEAKTFEQCKEEIALDRGYANWDLIPKQKQLIWAGLAAKKYADSVKKAYAEQAVKADRERIGADVDSWTYANFQGTVICQTDKLMKLPIELP